MAGEDLEAIKTTAQAWTTSFGSTSPAAAQLARRAAEAAVRLERADRIRDRILLEALEDRVADSEPARVLRKADHARELVAALAALAADIQGPIRRDHAAQLAAPAQDVVLEVVGLRLAPELTFPLSGLAGALADPDALDDVPRKIFEAIAETCAGILEAIDARRPDLVRAVDAERERQREQLVVLDTQQLRAVDKVRGRLLRELEAVLRAAKALKELEAVNASAVAPAPPVPVVFRVMGRPR